jgi:hypothetical protein
MVGDMRVVPTAEDWDIARRIYRLFWRKPGSECIASKFALAHLSAILHNNSIEKVLEFGSGIGTITYLLLTHPNKPKKITCTEKNAFCIEQLSVNLPTEIRSNLVIHTGDYNDITESFDLVIIDSAIRGISHCLFLGEKSICFAEGQRTPERKHILKLLKKRKLTCKFKSYYRGRRWFPFEWRKRKSGRHYIRLNFSPYIKGCWIGRVRRLRRQRVVPTA